MDDVQSLKAKLKAVPRDAWGNEVFPDLDTEPEWVKWRDQLADLTGNDFHRARYRTGRAFQEALAASGVLPMSPEEAWADLKTHFAQGARWTVQECADRWQITLSAASRRISSWETQGLIRTAKHGRTKRIAWINTLKKAA